MYKKIEGRPIRIAIVGCGRISKNHFSAVEKNDYELVAICDSDETRLNDASERHGVNAYLSLNELLDIETIDMVSLCTPSGMHAKQVMEISRYNIDIITEKPMATRWQDGLKMVEACDDANVRLFVVKQNRHNTTLNLLKRAFDEGRFGKVHMVHVNVFWTRPQAYYDQDNWRGTWEFDGGAFMNQASHYVDLLEWLIGPVQDVQAMVSTTRAIEVEDTGVLNLRWRNGALGSMSVTMLTYPKNLEGSITILGEKGTVRIGGVAVNDIQEWSFEDERDYDQEINAVNYETTSVYGRGHVPYYANVRKVMSGGEGMVIDGREGLKSLELLVAAYISARDNKTVSLPLEY